MYARAATPIDPDETAGELGRGWSASARPCSWRCWPTWPIARPSRRVGEATHAPKLSVDEFRLDWSAPARELARQVMAGNPRPGAWTEVDGRRLKVLRARAEPVDPAAPTPVGPVGQVETDGCVATGGGCLRLLEVQPEGKPAMAASAWLAGCRGDLPRLGP